MGQKKLVFITGASSGIGKATALLLASQGHSLLLCARRQEKLQEVVDEIQHKHKSEVHSFLLDVSNPSEVERTLLSLPSSFKNIDVLVNNAGNAYGLDTFCESSLDDWIKMIDINIKGLLFVTQWVLRGMMDRNRGHIVNLGSISSHEVYAKGTVYCATKHAVKAITDGLKKEVHGTPIRISSVDPGLVDTEFSVVRLKDSAKAKAVYQGMKPLEASDIADAISYCISRPDHVNIKEMIILPTAQSSVTMIDRKEI
jgi:3-hydroxy acid dehydrogenase/malonic semialdehyde reductase